jgi:predicted TIM-barrel fold metal-dependent hydrolase
MIAVPNSSGTSLPRYKAPPGACDSHIHIYDTRFPMAWPKLRAVTDASVAEYKLLQQRNGTSRVIVVQPAAYGTDNSVTVDAIEQLGMANALGIAVLHPSVSDERIKSLHEGGIRGLRFSQHEPRTAITSADMIEPLAVRIADLGWNVQLHLRGDQIVEMADLLARLPGKIVLDHMARLSQPEGTRHAAFGIVQKLLDTGRVWVKLSGPYLDTKIGAPRYTDIKPVARAFVEHAPERCVWGSDWPHPTEPHTKPDDAILFDLLMDWALDEPTRHRILVANPAALYGF